MALNQNSIDSNPVGAKKMKSSDKPQNNFEIEERSKSKLHNSLKSGAKYENFNTSTETNPDDIIKYHENDKVRNRSRNYGKDQD
jgi:hypothetical protein